MSKEYNKGVLIGADLSEENISEFETNMEETKTLIRTNEEDLIQGLIAAAGFATEEKQPIEIIRGGRLYFAFSIRPLCSDCLLYTSRCV